MLIVLLHLLTIKSSNSFVTLTCIVKRTPCTNRIVMENVRKPEFIITTFYHSYIFNLYYICLHFLSRCFKAAAVVALLICSITTLLYSASMHLLLQPQLVVLTIILLSLHKRKNSLHKNKVAGISDPLCKGVVNGPANPVLAGPLFLKVKTKLHFTKSKFIANKSARVIFVLVRLVILWYSK